MQRGGSPALHLRMVDAHLVEPVARAPGAVHARRGHPSGVARRWLGIPTGESASSPSRSPRRRGGNVGVTATLSSWALCGGTSGTNRGALLSVRGDHLHCRADPCRERREKDGVKQRIDMTRLFSGRSRSRSCCSSSRSPIPRADPLSRDDREGAGKWQRSRCHRRRGDRLADSGIRFFARRGDRLAGEFRSTGSPAPRGSSCSPAWRCCGNCSCNGSMAGRRNPADLDDASRAVGLR